jgi:hypothetical protein
MDGNCGKEPRLRGEGRDQKRIQSGLKEKTRQLSPRSDLKEYSTPPGHQAIGLIESLECVLVDRIVGCLQQLSGPIQNVNGIWTYYRDK